jgi:hypothetical protein
MVANRYRCRVTPCTNRSLLFRHGIYASAATAAVRCGIINEVHTEQRDLPLRDIIKQLRHDGLRGWCRTCGVADWNRRSDQSAGAQDHAAGGIGTA